MSSKPLSKRERRQEELRRREEEQRRAAKMKRTILFSAIAVAIVLAVVGGTFFFINLRNQVPNASGNGGTGASSNFSNTNNSAGQSINSIRCDSTEQLNYHVHSHLSIYINGQQVPVSQNIGITNSCYYWLHTHDASGIIHIEAPQQQTFTLGTFLNLWKSQFSQLQYPSQFNDPQGWQAYVDGKPYSGDINGITLDPHRMITLAYKSPGIKPDSEFNWQGL